MNVEWFLHAKNRKTKQNNKERLNAAAVHPSLHKMALAIHVSSAEPELRSDLPVFLQVTIPNTDTTYTLVFTLLHPGITTGGSK